MIEALRNITSNDDSRRIIIANPTNPASYMGQIFRNEDSAWSKHTISVLESPNFTKEAKELPEEVLKRLSGPQYVEDMKKDHGETDRSEEHTSELQSRGHLVCRLLLEKKKQSQRSTLLWSRYRH